MTDQELIDALCRFYNLNPDDGESLCKIKTWVIKRTIKIYNSNGHKEFVKNIDPEDLNCAAILGIVEGINMYDHKRGMKLTTWCTYKIKEQVRKIINEELKFIKGRDGLTDYTTESIDEEVIDGVVKALECLDPRQKMVIKRYHGLGKDTYGEKETFVKIGKESDISKQRVHQIYKEGINNLRRELFEIYPDLFRN